MITILLMCTIGLWLMIKYKKGCLIKAAKSGEVSVIAHQTNGFHTFGTGLAKKIKQEFPIAYEADLGTRKGDINKLGTLSVAYDKRYSLYICNLYGQHYYGRDKQYTDYEALKRSMERVRHMYISGFVYDPEFKGVLGLPRIGCGLAGGDWAVVSSLIEDTLGDVTEVVVYDL